MARCFKEFIGCMPAPLPPPERGRQRRLGSGEKKKKFYFPNARYTTPMPFCGLTLFRFIRRPGSARPQPRLRREAAASSYVESLWYERLYTTSN